MYHSAESGFEFSPSIGRFVFLTLRIEGTPTILASGRVSSNMPEFFQVARRPLKTRFRLGFAAWPTSWQPVALPTVSRNFVFTIKTKSGIKAKDAEAAVR